MLDEETEIGARVQLRLDEYVLAFGNDRIVDDFFELAELLEPKDLDRKAFEEKPIIRQAFGLTAYRDPLCMLQWSKGPTFN